LNNAKFIIQVSKGLIRQAKARRLLMFYSVLVALVLLFAGATFLWPFLREHPILFIGYWAACGWITILAALLSVYDLARVRSEARQARRELENQHFEKHSDDENPR
jgi:predicted MFS family arabinose efflux permease